MTTSGWQLTGAASGLLFVVLYLTAFGVVQNPDYPPAGSGPPDQFLAFAEAERGRMALATVMYVTAWGAFLFFMGGIRSPRSAPDSIHRLEAVGTGAGLLVVGLSLAGTGLQAEILLADPTTDPATLLSQWALFDASGGLLGITPLLRAVFVGTLAVVALRSGGIVRWVGWFGIVVAALNALGAVDYVNTASWSLTGHPLLDLYAFLAWVAMASVAQLLRHPTPGLDPVPPAADRRA
jgi:hypothetical protein